MNHNISTQNGFTFIEIVVAALVSSIIMMISVPALGKMLNDGRTAEAAVDLFLAVAQARTDAVNNGLPVTMCAIAASDELACAPDGQRSWDQGWLVFVDKGDVMGQFDAGDSMLRIRPSLGEQIDITGNLSKVSFRPTGRLHGASVDFSVNATGCFNDKGWMVQVSRSGAPRKQETRCGAA